ncbi:MAG: imidazolonepropionase [Clostridiales bacterium]|nr:imidazolonepropionase [Clostridiales bacterium]
MLDLLLSNIGLLVTPRGAKARAGQQQGSVSSTARAAVGIEGGKIAYAGPGCAGLAARQTLDCGGALVTPGLVDAHTHLVFGGWRQDEFALRQGGAPYMDVLRAGGGILSTVARTRVAGLGELVARGKGFLGEMLGFGVTTAEAKSGYGLDLENELKQLRAIRELGDQQPVTLVPTFMGAHAVPAEFSGRREAYVALVCDKILPAVAEERLAKFCDVFCEDGAFTVAESRAVLARAAELGMGLKAHADELAAGGGAELAAEMGCVSAEHLIHASDAGIRALAGSGAVAVALPCTSFFLGKPFARARQMVDEGLAVAVATDFNPGSCPCLNLQLAMSLACLRCGLTPAETLTAATLNGAAAIGLASRIGSIEAGKDADIVVWDAPDLDYLFYRLGSNLARTVVKAGAVCADRPAQPNGWRRCGQA